MKQRNHERPRLLAWVLCLAMVLSMVPMAVAAADEYEDITPEGWALNITKWNGWATGYSTAASYSDSDKVLSAAVTKESSYNAANRLISPALTSAVENVEAIDITISFEHSEGSSGNVCLQLDAGDGDQTFTNGGWGKVDDANPQLSSTAQTYRFVRQSDKMSSLKQLVLYFYVGDSWDGEFNGTAKISSVKVYKTKTSEPDPGDNETGELMLGTKKYTFTKDTFGKASWPNQDDPKLNSAGEIELTGSSLTTGNDGWGDFADYGLHVIEWPKASNSGLDLNGYDQAELIVTYPAGAQNTDKAKLAVEINTGKKSNTQLATLDSSGGSATLSFELAAIENTDDQTDTPLTIRVLANGSGTNTNTVLFDSSYTIKLSNIKFSKSEPPASKFTITAKTTIPNVETVWFQAFEPTTITKSEQTISFKVEPGDGGAFHADSVKAQKEDGTDISTAVSLSFDKEHDKVTLNTANIDHNIVLEVNYGWVSDPVDTNTNTIKAVFIGNGQRQDYENKEAMDPYKADYTPGDKLVFKVATVLWGGFPLDKITASAGETDITDKLTIEDGETGYKKVTIDTTGLSGAIELLATYSSSWSNGGGGSGGGSVPVTTLPGGSSGSGTSVGGAGNVSTEIRAESRGGVLTTEVTPEVMDKVIAQVEKSKEETELVTFQAKGRRSTTATALTIQSTDLAALGEKTRAGLKAESGVADVTITNEAVKYLGKQGGEIAIKAQRAKDVYTVSVTSGGEALAEVPGGLHVNVYTPCSFSTQAYLVKENGEEELIRWTIANQKGDAMRMDLPGTATIKFVDAPITFTDLRDQGWGSGPVEFTASRKIFNGYEDGSFRPNEYLDRAMMVQVLYNFEDRPAGSSLPQFSDVVESDWYAQAVGWAEKEGIVSGYGNGSFGVSDIVDRQDAVCILYRWMGSPKTDEAILDKYADAASVSPYARQAVAWALENGILTGDTAITIGPEKEVTRYQAAKLITDLVRSQTAWSGIEKEDR